MKYIYELGFKDKPECKFCMLSGSRGLDGNGETVIACYGLNIRPKCPEYGYRKDCPLKPLAKSEG